MRIFSYAIIVFSLLLIACQKEESTVFNASADERVNKTLSEYVSLISKPQNGWKATYFPDSTKYGGWTFLMKFEADGSVNMNSDFNQFTTSNQMKSKYRVSITQAPTLTFETYTYIHLLSDPGMGVPGEGLNGDFEFAFDRIVGDTIFLKSQSRKGKSVLKLVAAKSEDLSLDKNFEIQSALIQLTSSPNLPYFKTLRVGETNIDVSYNEDKRELILKYLKDGEIVTVSRGVSFQKDRIELATPVLLPNVSKPLPSLPLTIDAAGVPSLNLSEYGLSGSLTATHIPAIPYLTGIVDIQKLEMMVVKSVSESLSDMYNEIKKIPYFQSLQFYFNYPVKNGVLNEIDIFTRAGSKRTWYGYQIDWDFGDDGVLKGTYRGTTNGAAYETIIKPFIDKICNPDGFTVLDVISENYSSGTMYTVELVSRADSRDRLKLNILQ